MAGVESAGGIEGRQVPARAFLSFNPLYSTLPWHWPLQENGSRKRLVVSSLTLPSLCSNEQDEALAEMLDSWGKKYYHKTQMHMCMFIVLFAWKYMQWYKVLVKNSICQMCSSFPIPDNFGQNYVTESSVCGHVMKAQILSVYMYRGRGTEI